MNYVILAGLIATGVYDVILSVKDKETLSQQYQKLFPTWIDIIILAANLTLLCFLPIHPALKIWMAGISGHICWPNKERFAK